jgi:hypothetical protein
LPSLRCLAGIVRAVRSEVDRISGTLLTDADNGMCPAASERDAGAGSVVVVRPLVDKESIRKAMLSY